MGEENYYKSLSRTRVNTLQKGSTRSLPNIIDDSYTISSNFAAMQNLKYHIIVKESNLYLTTKGLKEELTFEHYKRRSSNTQFFNIKVPPAVMGVPYLIYSTSLGTLISSGSYPNNPNYNVMMARENNSGSTFGASWDILPSSIPGYMILQNQDILKQGDSGHWMDIYKCVAETTPNNKTHLGKYIESPKQLFKIIPNATFEITEINFINPHSATVKRIKNEEVHEGYTNHKNTMVEYDMHFAPTFQEKSNFLEREYISFRLKGEKRFKIPEVIQGKLFLQPSQNADALSLYKRQQTINRTFDTILPLMVEKRTRIDITYFYAVYEVEADFEAYAVYNDIRVKLVGRWNGKIHVDELQDEHIIKKTNLDTGETRSLKMTTQNLTKTNRLII